MSRTFLALANLAAAIVPAGAQAQDPGETVLEPTSAWNATYDDGKCRLSRMFGTGEQKHALVFEQAAPDARFQMSVAGPALADINAGRKLRLAFGPGGSESEQDVVKQRNAEFGAVMFLKDIALAPDAVAAAEATVGIGLAVSTTGIDTEAAEPLREITLAQEGRALVFRTGPLAAPFGVLNDCTAHILTTWGIDPAAHRAAQHSTRLLDVEKVARGIQERYPPQAVMERRGGVVGLAILVDAQGTPTECRITSDSGDDSLNALACDRLMKARFDPALDASGEPITSYWQTRVTYRIAN